MNAEHIINESENTSRYPRLPLMLLLAGVLLVLLAVLFKGWRLYRLAQSFQGYQEQAEALAEDGIMNANPEQAEALVNDLRRDVVALEREVGYLLPLGRFFGWVPRVGPLLANGEAFMDMADSGSEAAVYAVRGLKPALYLVQDDAAAGADLLPELLPIIEAAEADILAASAALDRAVEARSLIENVEALPWRVRTLLEMVDGKLYLADELKLLTVLPTLMGSDGPTTYLILAQNEDEIRPTGGFLTGAGLLRLQNGRIVGLIFDDGNVIDDWRNKPYDFPPTPFYELMGLELFLFRDANYWPDFPTSAEHAMQLYTYGQGDVPELDGAIAIDQQFVAMLLAVTGPVDVAELDTPVNSNNAIDSFRQAWAAEEDESLSDWIGERKDFLGPLADAMRRRLIGDFRSIDPLFLAETIHRAATEKHLQFYARDPHIAAVLDEINWDGRLEPPFQGDFLMLVETNVGYNKVNSLVERELTYEVELRENGTGAAILTANHKHMGNAGDTPCEQLVEYVEGITYNTLMNRCYWSFLRLYAPSGISLVQGPQHQLPPGTVAAGSGWQQASETVLDSDQATFLATPFVLPQGSELTSRYVYELPVVTQENGRQVYRLKVAKQAGLAPYPVTVQVTVPDGMQIADVSPQAAVEGRRATFNIELARDIVLEVAYR